ncbi:MAG: hypothetical protein RJQ14_19730 [Marinoscillum sp.]
MNLNNIPNDFEMNLHSMNAEDLLMARSCAYKVKNHLERHTAKLNGVKFLTSLSEINTIISAYEYALTHKS